MGKSDIGRGRALLASRRIGLIYFVGAIVLAVVGGALAEATGGGGESTISAHQVRERCSLYLV